MAVMETATTHKPFPKRDHQVSHPQALYIPWCPKVTRLKWVGLCILLVCALILMAHQLTTSSVSYPVHQFTTSIMSSVRDQRGGKSHIRARHTSRRLPQCIIIGARKAGTRALLAFLNLHPQVVTAKSEIHYFDVENNYSHGVEWYRKHMPFSFSDQITIEKTPGYFVADKAPQRVYSMNKTIKLILIVRDPTERAISDYLQLMVAKYSRNGIPPTFEELAIHPDTGEVNRQYGPVKRSLYDRHIRRWLEYFHLQQIHLVDGAELVKNPPKELRKVENFLGLDHKITEDMFYFNQSKGFYCIHNGTQDRCLAPSKGRPHPKVDDAVIRKLKQFYHIHNEKFFRQVHRRFDWP